MSHVEHTVHGGGLKGLANAFEAMQSKVRVGYIKGTSNPQAEEGGVSCAQVAAWNTFGTRNEDGTVRTPERPFMQQGLTAGKHDMARLNRINLLLCLQGKMGFKQALGQLGGMATGFVKRAIAESKTWALPNAPRTIAAKTRDGKIGDQPLKDTGNMEQAATWSVD